MGQGLLLEGGEGLGEAEFFSQKPFQQHSPQLGKIDPSPKGELGSTCHQLFSNCSFLVTVDLLTIASGYGLLLYSTYNLLFVKC